MSDTPEPQDPSVLDGFKLYHYDPSLAGNIIFAIFFAVASTGHAFLLYRHRTWYFIPFLVGCLVETIGYITRSINATETPDWSLGPYVTGSVLILIGPALYAASIYMILGRLIMLLDAHQHAVIRTKWLTKIFVAGDVLSFLMQSSGGGLLATAKTPSSQDLANNIILGGLGVQILFFALFMTTTVIFHVRILRRPTGRSRSVVAQPWRQFLWVLYFTSATIMIRSLFRMIEYAAGFDSVLMKSEAYLLVLDALLMALVAGVFLHWHPSKILVGYKEVSSGGGVSGGGSAPATRDGDGTDVESGGGGGGQFYSSGGLGSGSGYGHHGHHGHGHGRDESLQGHPMITYGMDYGLLSPPTTAGKSER